MLSAKGVHRAASALESAHNLAGNLVRLLLPVAPHQHLNPAVGAGNVERPLSVFSLVPVGNRTNGTYGGVCREVHLFHGFDYAEKKEVVNENFQALHLRRKLFCWRLDRGFRGLSLL